MPARLRDPALPQLEALLDPARMAEEIGRLVDGERIELVDVTVLRHKPARRCTLRYDIEVGPAGGRRRVRLYGKTFASARGPRVYTTLRAIGAARPWGSDVSIPEPAGYVASLRLVLQREAGGEPIARALLAGDRRLAERVAETLQALHGSGANLDRRHGLADELAALEARVGRLGAGYPALLPAARRCLRRVRRGSGQPWFWRWRPVHRDFYHDQILVGEKHLSVLDFDDAAMSEPALDVANFLAHLRLLALQEIGAPAGLARIADAFCKRYLTLDPKLDRDLVCFLEGSTLLRLAQIHLPRAGGERLAECLLGESERLLQARHQRPDCRGE